MRFDQPTLPTARLWRAVTGLTADEFTTLLPAFTAARQAAREQAWAERTRQRRPGGGRRCHALPTPAAQFFFILFYVRLYPTQDLLAALCGLSQPQVCTWVQFLLPVLQQALGRALVLPARPASTLAELQQRCPDLVFLLDATEQPRPRPGTEAARQQQYSWKRRHHAQKTTIVTNATGTQIVFLGTPHPGRMHDKTAVEADAPPFPPGSRIGADLGYLGYHPPETTVVLPHKTRWKAPTLTPAQQQANTAHAGWRVHVEHAIAGMKRWRSVRDLWRGRLPHHPDHCAEVAAGLFNYTRCIRGTAETTPR